MEAVKLKLSEQKEMASISKRKGVSKKKLIDTPYQNNINTVVEKPFSSENRLSGTAANDEVLKYHQHQTVKQFEVVEEVVLPEVSKLNDSVMTKNQGDQTQFFPEKDS